MALNLTKLQKHELFTCYSSYQWLSPWVAVCMHGERCAHAPPSAPPGAAVPPFQVLSSDSAPRCAAPPGDLTPEVPCCCVLFLRGSSVGRGLSFLSIPLQWDNLGDSCTRPFCPTRGWPRHWCV